MRSRRTFRAPAWAVLAAVGALGLTVVACKAGGGCAPRVPAPSAPASLPDGRGTVATPSPAPDAPPAVATRMAAYFPDSTDILAVFKGDKLRGVMQAAAGLVPRLLMIEKAEELPARIQELYGVNVATLGPWCALGRVGAEGPLMICDRAMAVPPRGSTQWSDVGAKAYTVVRGTLSVAFALDEGRFLAGSEAAVRHALKVRAKVGQPLVTPMSEWRPDAFGLLPIGHPVDVAVFFPTPSAAPWCSGDCMTTLAWFDSDGASVLARERAPTGLAARKVAVETFFRAAVLPFERLRDSDDIGRVGAIPDLTLESATRPILTMAITQRADATTLVCRGDVTTLAILAQADLLELLFGEPRNSGRIP